MSREISLCALWAAPLALAVPALAQLGPGEVLRSRKISEATAVFSGGLDPDDQLGSRGPGGTATLVGNGLLFIVGRMAPLEGLFLHGDEVLVGGAFLFRSASPSNDGIAVHGNPLPADPALAGLQVFTQGVILGGGLELLNAVDLVIGY